MQILERYLHMVLLMEMEKKMNFMIKSKTFGVNYYFGGYCCNGCNDGDSISRSKESVMRTGE